jgi:hypothetical protein
MLFGCEKIRQHESCDTRGSDFGCCVLLCLNFQSGNFPTFHESQVDTSLSFLYIVSLGMRFSSTGLQFSVYCQQAAILNENRWLKPWVDLIEASWILQVRAMAVYIQNTLTNPTHERQMHICVSAMALAPLGSAKWASDLGLYLRKQPITWAECWTEKSLRDASANASRSI